MAGEKFVGQEPPPQRARIVWTYDVPEEAQGDDPDKVTTVGIVELTAQEEVWASKRSGGNSAGLAFELWKQSLAEVNGKPVTIGDGSADIWAAKFSSKLRTLIMTAYADINTPTDGGFDSFRKSRRAKI